MKKNRDLDKVS